MSPQGKQEAQGPQNSQSSDEGFTSDVVHRTLAAALDAARATGKNVGRGRASRNPYTSRNSPNSYSSANSASSSQSCGGNGPRGEQHHRGAGKASTGRRRRYSWTSSGPDKWDPQLLTALVADTIQKHGWQHEVIGGRIIHNWPEIMGEEIASHSHVEKLDEDGVLYIRTDTTAWATQLRLLQPNILAELGKKYGKTVRMLRILGPAQPSWRKGPRHVKGRGPRDTYG